MRSLLITGLKLVVSVGLLSYLIFNANLDGLTSVFSSTIPSLFVLAVLFFVLSNALGALQWYMLLQAQDLQITFRQAVVFYWIGVFFNNVLLGNIGGDAMRIYDVKRLTGDVSGGAAATFMDRFIGLFSTCTLALLAFVALSEIRSLELVAALVPIWLGLFLFLAMGLSRRVGAFIEDHIIEPILPSMVTELISRLRRSVIVYRHRVPLLGCVWLVSMGVQLSRIFVYWSAGLAVGLKVGAIYFVAFQPIAAIVAALPISIGGLGVRENVMVELFSSVGSEPSTILAMSLLGYAAGIIASLLGGIAFIIRRVERA